MWGRGGGFSFGSFGIGARGQKGWSKRAGRVGRTCRHEATRYNHPKLGCSHSGCPCFNDADIGRHQIQYCITTLIIIILNINIILNIKINLNLNINVNETTLSVQMSSSTPSQHPGKRMRLPLRAVKIIMLLLFHLMLPDFYCQQRLVHLVTWVL